MFRPMPRRPPEPVSVRTVRLTTAWLASLRPGFRCIASFVAILLIWQALQHRSGSQLLTRPHTPLLDRQRLFDACFPNASDETLFDH